MRLEDLHYIFREQIEGGIPNLYFMIDNGDRTLVEQYPTNKIQELLPMLDDFTYAGSEIIPRFVV